MAKAAKGKSVAKVVKGVKPKPLPAKIPVKKPVVKQPIKKVDKVVEKPKVKKKVEKVEVKEQPVIHQPIVTPQPIPVTLEPDIQQAHFTEQEFDQKFVKATFADFKQGQQVFIKDRYGDKWVAKLVDQIGVVSVDSAQFNDLVLRDNAYIKR